MLADVVSQATVSPGAAPIRRPILLPTVIGVCHHPRHGGKPSRRVRRGGSRQVDAHATYLATLCEQAKRVACAAPELDDDRRLALEGQCRCTRDHGVDECQANAGRNEIDSCLHGGSRVAGLERPAVLRLQQTHVAAASHVERMTDIADEGSMHSSQRRSAPAHRARERH